jgi:hypothetical protein
MRADAGSSGRPFFTWTTSRKTTRGGGVTRKIEDNQLELAFANGKAIIPPLIEDRERIWALVNSMPVEIRDDGQVRSVSS